MFTGFPSQKAVRLTPRSPMGSGVSHASEAASYQRRPP